MKTGIVRRIDDVGRIAIPKEIRRSMRISDGEPIEIFTTAEGQIVLQKYLAGEVEQIDSTADTSAEDEGIKVTLKPEDDDKVFLTLSKSAYELLCFLEDYGYLACDMATTRGHDFEIKSFLENRG